MGIMKDVVEEEFNRLNALIEQYEIKIASYPKGSLSVKKRNDRSFCYQVYRDHDKVRYIYLGKPDSPKTKDFVRILEERRRYERMRKQSKESLKEVRAMLRAAK